MVPSLFGSSWRHDFFKKRLLARVWCSSDGFAPKDRND
jgi:hypothetical protein